MKKGKDNTQNMYCKKNLKCESNGFTNTHKKSDII